MKDDTASHTARHVAAHRLDYERIPAPYGDPAADEALTRDVAGGMPLRPGRMHDYLRARTAFFDRVVVRSLDRGVRQVVVGGAGYDGRALRYGKQGVGWFEVDHPATQADKCERLDRLGLDPGHVSFVTADFTADPVAERLLAAGLRPGQLALFLFEGVAVYLDDAVTERVLSQFRQVTPPGSVLAISVSTSAGGAARERFADRLAALGESARSALREEEARALLARAGWRADDPEGPRRARLATVGLLVARAAADYPERIVPAPPAPAASTSEATRQTSEATPQPAPPPAPNHLPLSALLSHVLVA
ncbi:MAG TPA: SAM-dependent methyltransferase [Trebonia sp.]